MTMHVVCENLLQKRQTRYQHVQCVCAVNPSICASDVSDCQITLLCYIPSHRTNVEMPRPGHFPRQMICVFDTEALRGSLPLFAHVSFLQQTPHPFRVERDACV